jgi:hypothetical protein
MCTIRLPAALAPRVALRSVARVPVRLPAMVPPTLALHTRQQGPLVLAQPTRGGLSLRSRAKQRRLLTQSGAYLVTEDGRRIVIGVCFG